MGMTSWEAKHRDVHYFEIDMMQGQNKQIDRERKETLRQRQMTQGYNAALAVSDPAPTAHWLKDRFVALLLGHDRRLFLIAAREHRIHLVNTLPGLHMLPLGSTTVTATSHADVLQAKNKQPALVLHLPCSN